MGDNFKKVLCHLDVEDIKEILDEFEFPKSKKKDDLIEIILKNATVFEYAVDWLFEDSTIAEIRILCDDLGIDWKKIHRGELEKKILDKLNKNIENINIENKINFLSSPSAFHKDDLEDILDNHGISCTGKKEKLVKGIAKNDFLVGRAMIEWKKELQKEDIKKMCQFLEIDSEGNRENLLQKIDNYVFKNEINTDIQNESPSKINSSKNMNDMSLEFSLTIDPELVNDIVEEIKSYKPSRKTSTELPYETGLHGFLSKSFPQLETQITRGRTRPDIVIGNIAIEIKGPTTMTHINSLGDKLLRYPEFWGKLIIVLFDIQVSDGQLNDIKKATAKHHPDFGIIIVK